MLADLFYLRGGEGVYTQWISETKEEYNNHILHFQFFSVVPSRSFYTYPIGLKRQKRQNLSHAYCYINP